MEFFNKKEEVLNVELTEYGEYLLAIGKLNPTYYAFFDDDIIYDSSYAGFTDEEQNAIQDRIEQTPRAKGSDARTPRARPPSHAAAGRRSGWAAAPARDRVSGGARPH